VVSGNTFRCELGIKFPVEGPGGIMSMKGRFVGKKKTHHNVLWRGGSRPSVNTPKKAPNQRKAESPHKINNPGLPGGGQANTKRTSYLSE